MKLQKHLVDKPWGRNDISSAFGDMGGRQIGEIWYESDGADNLPILVKWLFTSEKLSIQVHPNDAQAKERGMPSGKEECWFIVDAEPGAVIGIGTKQSLSADELRDASLSGKIESLIDWKPVRAGDYFYIPAGTVHAIGAGVTLVEVQQYADITFRLYDYGRPRELHLDDGVAVSVAVPYTDQRSGHASGNTDIATGPHFWLSYVTDQDALEALPNGGRRWVVPVEGNARTSAGTIATGDCALIEQSQRITIEPQCRLLVAGADTH
jgi:mannose-6-phosphate isomerase